MGGHHIGCQMICGETAYESKLGTSYQHDIRGRPITDNSKKRDDHRIWAELIRQILRTYASHSYRQTYSLHDPTSVTSTTEFAP